MRHISAKTRIALGQGCLVASVLLIALGLRLVPDYREAVMHGRAQLCESIAVSSSLQLSRSDWKGLEAALRTIAARNPDILSAAVRRLDGKKMVQIGDHSTWRETVGEMSDDAQVQIPLHNGTAKWGHVELRFQPLSAGGFAGFLHNPYTRLVGFVSASTLLVFFFYLGKVLEQLNPSKVVPGRVRTALNTLVEGLLVLDRSERVVLANEAFAGLLGRPADKLIGSRAAQFPWLQPEQTSGPIVYPWSRTLLEQRQSGADEMRLRAHTGEVKTFVVNCSPLVGHDGKCRGVLASFDDVTHLEEHKRELSKSKEEAEAANRAKSEFLARMSHEIRTPMNAILGFTDVLRRGFDCDRQERQEYLNTIHSSGQHLLNIINDILDLSKVEAGKLEIERLRVSPVQLISEVVSVLRVRAQEKGIALESVVASAMPETIVTDPVRLRQMLMNLVGNAIKFTETGGVKVVARFMPSGAKPTFVIEVIDTGIGIAREGLDKIFQPFAQADTSVTRRFGGTGLGLTICRRFADLLGGNLSVQSEVGVGSIFTLTFDPGPLDGVRLLDPQAAMQLPNGNQRPAIANVQLTGVRILVADDGAENRKLLTLVLGRAGARVKTANNGQMAVELATTDSFEVILMDVEMPVMDGYSAVKALRGMGVTTPIFALTAHAMKGDEEKCKAAGFSGYLTKPINLDQLLTTLAYQIVPDRVNSTAAQSPTGQDSLMNPSTEQTTNGQAPAAAEQELKPDSEPVEEMVSSLPTEDPEFLEIVREFVQRLDERLAAMVTAVSRGDTHEIAQVAHWLKGSGGMAGFDAFTEPAGELERVAKQKQMDQIPAAFARIQALARRIRIPNETAGCAESSGRMG